MQDASKSACRHDADFRRAAAKLRFAGGGTAASAANNPGVPETADCLPTCHKSMSRAHSCAAGNRVPHTMMRLMLGLCFLVACSAANATDIARITDDESRRVTLVREIRPGGRLRIADLEGPGIVRHLQFTAMSPDPRLYDGLVLRAWWDGETSPGIEAPLGDFFGCGFGEERPVQSIAVEMVPAGLPGHAALTCWLPMPFQSARLEVANETTAPVQFFCLMNWEKVDSLEPGMGRLHAQWRRSNPVERGRPHTALKATGRGHYIGMVWSIRRMGGGAWVEGGEDFHIDLDKEQGRAVDNWDRDALPPGRRVPADERTEANQPAGPVRPTLAGIGAEDYFGMSWGFRPDHAGLHHGVAFDDEASSRTSAYRFHMPDPVRFRRNLRVLFRNHGWDVQARADDITTLVFWYQSEPHAPFLPLPPRAARQAPRD
jgi:hypothetical protein